MPTRRLCLRSAKLAVKMIQQFRICWASFPQVSRDSRSYFPYFSMFLRAEPWEPWFPSNGIEVTGAFLHDLPFLQQHVPGLRGPMGPMVHGSPVEGSIGRMGASLPEPYAKSLKNQHTDAKVFFPNSSQFFPIHQEYQELDCSSHHIATILATCFMFQNN